MPKKTLNDRFTDLADAVSEFIGTPTNIGFWVGVVVVWFLVFALNPALANDNFLPGWFTSNAFNFPLNSITTLIELYIGFLCAAATNRAEKALRQILKTIVDLVTKTEQIEEKQEEQMVQLLDIAQKSYDLLSTKTNQSGEAGTNPQ